MCSLRLNKVLVVQSLRYFLIALLALPLQAQVRSPFPWLPANFDTTVSGNYRGARIVSRAQLDSMKRVYGIATVVNLAKDALPKKGESEVQWTRELGIAYVPLYLGTQPPARKDWERVRGLLKGGRVYIHCAHGADRTGALVAKFRTEVEGVSPAEAYREARRFGFKPWLSALRAWFGYPGGGGR